MPMMYQGGKTRIAKQIAKVILSNAEGDTYIEPFLGSAAVCSLVAPMFSKVIAADIMPDLILMWRAVVNDGWIPPEVLPAELYHELRDEPPSALRAFAGFPCSFAGKWFGGYASDPNSDRNYARAASRSIMRRAASMADVDFRLCDYRKLTPLMRPGVVVYCDPPYARTL